MNTDHLIKMVNEISAFFGGESGPEQAPKEVAAHLKKFWEPRMRAKFLVLADGNAESMKPIVREAVTTHRAMLG